MVFYTGSYTQEGAPAANPIGKGISCFHFDESTGTSKLLHQTSQRSPSYLTISEGGNYLYAVEEMYANLKPRIYAYKIHEDYHLELLNSQPIEGDYACHLAICGNSLILANYVSGNALSYPILKNGSLGALQQTIQHTGTGPNFERQEAPHVHMVYILNETSFFLVDLGLDKAKYYRFSTEKQQWFSDETLDIAIESGAGARHMLQNKKGTHVYLLSELTGEIHIVKLDTRVSKTIQKVSIVPEDYKGDFGAAALRMHPNGDFLYASCRGTNTISAYAIDSELKTLSLIAHYDSYGETPRDFNIHPNGEWLLAANQDSNEIVSYKLDSQSGALTYHTKFSAETVVNIAWSKK